MHEVLHISQTATNLRLEYLVQAMDEFTFLAPDYENGDICEVGDLANALGFPDYESADISAEMHFKGMPYKIHKVYREV